MGEIATFVYGYTDKVKDFGDVRFVRITDIMDDGLLDPRDAKYVELTEEGEKYLLHNGDLLLVRFIGYKPINWCLRGPTAIQCRCGVED